MGLGLAASVPPADGAADAEDVQSVRGGPALLGSGGGGGSGLRRSGGRPAPLPILHLHHAALDRSSIASPRPATMPGVRRHATPGPTGSIMLDAEESKEQLSVRPQAGSKILPLNSSACSESISDGEVEAASSAVEEGTGMGGAARDQAASPATTVCSATITLKRHAERSRRRQNSEEAPGAAATALPMAEDSIPAAAAAEATPDGNEDAGSESEAMEPSVSGRRMSGRKRRATAKAAANQEEAAAAAAPVAIQAALSADHTDGGADASMAHAGGLSPEEERRRRLAEARAEKKKLSQSYRSIYATPIAPKPPVRKKTKSESGASTPQKSASSKGPRRPGAKRRKTDASNQYAEASSAAGSANASSDSGQHSDHEADLDAAPPAPQIKVPPHRDGALPAVPDSIPLQPFDGAMADFIHKAEPAVPAESLVSPAPLPYSRAPSSQPLHRTRVRIFEELAQEYFGRYMKESPDAQPDAAPDAATIAAAANARTKHPRGAKHLPAPKVTAMAPEQLRHVFCEWFEEAAAHRVPSTAQHGSKTNLIIVPPVEEKDKLASFGAVDSASMRHLGSAPATIDEWREQMTRQPPRPAAMPMNPHFDLYQYAPLVANDEYEPIEDELSAQLQNDPESHPTLPMPRDVKEEAEAAAATPAANSPIVEAAPLPMAMEVDNVAADAEGDRAVLNTANDRAVKLESMVDVPSNHSAAEDPAAVKTEGEHAEPASAVTLSPDTTAAAAGSPAAPAPSPEVAGLSTNTNVNRCLPRTSHGVGMMASLDFKAPPSCGTNFQLHWTNNCFAWRFNNHNRCFSGHAFSSRNDKENDVVTVTQTLSAAQARFHADLVEDEKDEETWELVAPKQTRQAGEPGYQPGSEEYERIKRRIRSSFETSFDKSLFIPHTFLKEVAPKQHRRAEAMARECVAVLNQTMKFPADEEPVDRVFKLVVPGFGCAGVQVFLKVGLCVTLLHDEIGWCSALNYMTVRSRGCALWIGLNMHKASVRMSKEQLRHLINGTQFNLHDFLSKLKKLGLQPSMQLQTPGSCIYSPNGRGSAHIVITVGSWVEQIAINHSISPSGLRAATGFWEGADPLLHNSALATRAVVPLMWLQKVKGWEVGCGDQLAVLAELVRQVHAEGGHTLHWRDYDSPTDEEVYCDACFNDDKNRRAILFVRIDGMCPACFVHKIGRFMHFDNMIDKRFK